MTSESVSDAGLRQYEDIHLTPAALSFSENVSRPGLQGPPADRDVDGGSKTPGFPGAPQTREGFQNPSCDFNPGVRNGWVAWGDAHKLRSRFKEGTFGSMYTNVLDHIMHIDQFLKEAHYVLRPNGTLFVDMQDQGPSNLNWHNLHAERQAIEKQLQVGFRLIAQSSRKNFARQLHWDYVLTKVD
eukprot:2679253-Prymnesium_polylepis.2